MCVYLLPGDSEMSQQWRVHTLRCTAQHYTGLGRGAGRLFWQRDQILLRPIHRETKELSGAAATACMSKDLPPRICCGLWPHILLTLTSPASFTRPERGHTPGTLQGHFLSQHPEGSTSAGAVDIPGLPTLR